ncbi:hypothetical protein CFN78_24990 [Amycolatopsis antarctica]|uniref:Uncharacterized protein n=1 Tax=Amycolatopsis antarctica TaxID=1854586 RepID=A0A263CWA8_9PSEU|nr:hypothetical protein CFN78_24990 [Amycolatopsis antarctica]
MPAVIDADELHYMPPEVWVPIQPPAQRATEVMLELRDTRTNGLGLMAYSSAEALAAARGLDQPCVQIPAPELSRTRRIVGFDCVLMDVGVPESTEGELPELVPPSNTGLLYVPSRSHRIGSSNHAEINLFETEHGEVVLLAYSSVQQLRECCGERQPWIAIHGESIESVSYQAGADLVLFNEPPQG